MILKNPEARPSGNYATDRAGQPSLAKSVWAKMFVNASDNLHQNPKKRAVGKA